jgi:hypothetical protein
MFHTEKITYQKWRVGKIPSGRDEGRLEKFASIRKANEADFLTISASQLLLNFPTGI